MGFYRGSKIMADIVEEIANNLIATVDPISGLSIWSNVDTTWTTTVKTAINAKRVLAYGPVGGLGKGNTTLSTNANIGNTIINVTDSTNFATNDNIVIGSGSNAEVRVVTNVVGNTITISTAINSDHISGQTVKAKDLEIYLAMEVVNQDTNWYYGNQGWYYVGRGIRLVFSASWDAGTHTYPTSNQSTFVPFEGRQRYGTVDISNALYPVTYDLWIDSSGFAIMGRPNYSGDDTQQSFIIVVEKSPAKEYADGYTGFFCFTSGNMWTNCLYDGNWISSILRNRTLLRPFAYQYPDHGSWGSYTANGAGMSFVKLPDYFAYKSHGNNKVYYVKPLIHNSAGQIAPIFQSDLFFMWTEGVGLIDGDVVSIEGRTTKYLCRSLDSPSSTGRIVYGIKYVE